MANVTVTQREVENVINDLMVGCQYGNHNYQFIENRTEGVQFRYDMADGTYKFYRDRTAFARAIVRFLKRGY